MWQKSVCCTYWCREDSVKLMPPLEMTGPAFAVAAMLWALAMMLARSRGAAPAAVEAAGGVVLGAATGTEGGAIGLLTVVWPGCGVGGGSRPAPRKAPRRAIGSGVAGL